MTAMVLELKDEDRETYLVHPKLWSELSDEATVSKKLLIPAINRQGVLTLWPIRLPDENGKLDEWSRSALQAAENAKTTWIRLKANHGLGAYVIQEALDQTGDPDWPTETFEAVVKIAFKNKVIGLSDHPILRRLRGEN